MNKLIAKIKLPIVYDKSRRLITDASGKLEIEAGIVSGLVTRHHDSLYKLIVDALNEKLKQ